MFDDLHDPDPPSPGIDTLASVTTRARAIRRRRSMSIGGASLALVVVATTAVVFARIGGDHRITTVDNTLVPTPSTVTDSVPTSAAQSATTVPAVAPVPVGCTTIALPPVYLVDGSPTREPSATSDSEGTTTWGSDPETHVIQGLGIEYGFGFGDGSQPIVRGDFRAALGDEASNEIGISIIDDRDGCVRNYWISSGVGIERANAYVTQWLSYLDVDRSLSIEQTPDGQACTSVAGLLQSCLAMPDAEVAPLNRSAADGVAENTVAVLQLLVARGAEVSPLSTLARRVPLADNAGVELVVDLAPPCGTVTISGASSPGLAPTMDWSIDDSTCGKSASNTALASPLAAIDANGDAVVITSLDGASTVLYDGVDPDDPPLSEGDTTSVDGVALSPDGTTAVVGICCEPVAGSLVSVDLVTAEQATAGFGHLPAFAAGGNLVWAGYGSISIGSLDGAATTYEVDPSTGTVVDLAVIERGEFGGQILSIVAGPDGTTLTRQFVGGGDMDLSTTVSTATWTDGVEYSLAGYDGQGILVLDRTNGALLRFDLETLAPMTSDHGPVDWISAWIQDDEVRYIDGQRRLFVNGTRVPGEYIWVR